MADDNRRITICPSCKSRYRTPEAFSGRKVSCKGCGTSFTIEFEDENQQEERPLRSDDGRWPPAR
ncbi:MAG: zinc-ribbon domain-containing protein [Desulfobacterales bacterium]|nr:zinc-ribbon domain-containing protein [Desulfobacterales bacterium]